GTAAGTALVKDIFPGGGFFRDGKEKSHVKVPFSSDPSWLTDVNGTLFFSAYSGSHSLELWKSNGKAKGTVLVKEISPGPLGSGRQYLTALNGVLSFGAADGLWRSDGTAAGTVQVRALGADLRELTIVNGNLYFAAGHSLWRSDGTTAGTAPVFLAGV